MKYLVFGLALALSFLGGAQAQNTSFGMVDIIHNPHAPANFYAQVFIDRDTNGAGNARYRIGEMLRIGVMLSEAAHVYLFVVDSTGVVTQLLPNRFDGHGNSNHVQAGGTVYFPPSGSSYGYRVKGPYGVDKIFVLASKSPLTTSTLTGFNYEGAFAKSYGGEKLFGDRVLRSVSPLAQSGWVTDGVHYQVVP